MGRYVNGMEFYPLSSSRPRFRFVPIRRATRGFTLIELMVVLILVAILLGVSGPSFQNSLQRNRQQSAFNDVVTAMAFARAEAVVRNDIVAICPTVDTTSCSGANWETGWLIFVDNGGPAAGGTPSDGLWNGDEELLRIGSGHPNVTIRTINFPSLTSVAFTDSGRVFQNIPGTVTVCDGRGAGDARGLIVGVSGQGRLAVDTDANGVAEDNAGNSLECP